MLSKYPIDEAMSLAAGGAYNEIGPIELDVLRYAGRKPLRVAIAPKLEAL